MRTIQLFLLCLIPGLLMASSERNAKVGRDYTLGEPKADKQLTKTESTLDLVFKDDKNNIINTAIKLSYNGTEKKVQPNNRGFYVLTLKPGKYKFQFWYTDGYAEIFTDSIELKSAHRLDLTTNFQASINAVCFKPVIYLYPKETIKAQVKVDLKNNFIYTYPAHGENGWSITAHADGTLKQDNKTYGYLFWEGPVNFSEKDLYKQEGFVVNAGELTSFFEDKLTHMGLNGKEIQDYITYWVPRLQNQPKHFIRFLINENFDHYAPLTITPKPDNVLRIFMLSSPLEANETVTITEQVLPTFKREGFSVVEWGGTVTNFKKAQ